MANITLYLPYALGNIGPVIYFTKTQTSVKTLSSIFIRVQNPAMNTIAYESLIFNITNISNWWGENRLLSKWYWQNQITLFQKGKIDPFLTS